MDETIRHYANLVTPPGERYQYSNLGFGILDYVIERVSGKPYTAFMQQEVFDPLGMEHTAIPTSSADLDPSLEWAVRYWDLDTPLPFYDFDHRGASAVYSCAHDLVRFGMSHLGQTEQSILSRDSTLRMQQAIADPGPGYGYGIGWGLEEDRMGIRTVSHGGGMGGVATWLILAPEEGLVVAVLSNGSSGLPQEISHDIFAALLPDFARKLADSHLRQGEDEAPKPEVFPPDLLGVWEGAVETYQAKLPFRLEVTSASEAQATLGDAPPVALREIAIQNGYLTATMDGDIATPDANRREYDLHLSLRPRGAILNGAVTAISKRTPKLPNALTSWIELEKR